VQADLDELHLDLRALLDRAGRRDLLALALREHQEVVEVDSLLRLEVQAALRQRLQLCEPGGAGTDQERGHLRLELDAERLAA
jgi:hypothetical protein